MSEYKACFACQPKDSVACQFQIVEGCPFATILKALPGASESRRLLALAVLTYNLTDSDCDLVRGRVLRLSETQLTDYLKGVVERVFPEERKQGGSDE